MAHHGLPAASVVPAPAAAAAAAAATVARNNAEELPFSLVCDLLNRLASTRERSKLLRGAFERWRQVSREAGRDASEDNLFPLARVLYPMADRRVYGLKEAALAKVLASAMQIDSKNEDALKMDNFMKPVIGGVPNINAGDFPAVAFHEVLQKRMPHKPKGHFYSLADVNRALDRLAKCVLVGRVSVHPCSQLFFFFFFFFFFLPILSL